MSTPSTSPGGQPAGLPKITIVIPSYNQGQFLERTLQSIQAQDYPNLELLVLDGGSTDQSVEIIRRHASRIDYWVSQKDGGQSAAILSGWTRASGDILAWLNSDDYYFPGALGEVGRIFRELPRVMMLCGTIAIVDAAEKQLRLKPPALVEARRLLPWGHVPGQAAVFIRREVFETVGGPRQDLHYVMDWELWLRIALAYPPSAIHYSTQVLAGAREWEQAKTITAAGRDSAEVRRVLAELFEHNRLPDELQTLKNHCQARTWWRQADSESRAGFRSQALQSLLQAIRLAPGQYLPFKALKRMRQILRQTAENASRP